MAGKPPSKVRAQFIEDTHTMDTSELGEKYERADSTVRDWKSWARKKGLEVGDGKGKREDAGPNGEVKIRGLMPDTEDTPIEEVWERAIARQAIAEQKSIARLSQVIELPDEPVGLTFVSDIHVGSPNTDYKTAKRDAEIIKNSWGLYGGTLGDLGDNWIVPKLSAQAQNQRMTLAEEVRLIKDILGTIGEKLLFAVAGNHENWDYLMAGKDHMQSLLSGMRLLYDPHEIVFDLEVGKAKWAVKARHQWRGSSIFNDTHGLQVGWERGGSPFDIALGGHTHTGTWCVPFTRHSERKYAILLGTYKMDDGYGRQLGMRGTCGLGAGTIVITPDREFTFFEDVAYAAKFLKFLRQEWGAKV